MQKGLALSERSKSNGFAPILIVIIVAVLGIGGYFVYSNYSKDQTEPTQYAQPTQTPAPTQDPTSNWKTYTNTKYGYSFKYPPKLTSIEISPDKGEKYVVSIVGKSEGSTDEGYYTGLFSISSFTPGDLLYHSDETAKELLNLKVADQYKPPDRMVGSITRTYPTYKRLSDTTIGGLQAKVFETKTIDGAIAKRFYVNKEDNMYLIVSNFFDTQVEYYPQELYDQILSTFRFTQ